MGCSLLYEQVVNPAQRQRPGVPPKVGHQIPYFDPRGDGKIAEMWGPIDPGTRHVAVLVPGTTVNMDAFGTYSQKMSLLAGDGIPDTADSTVIGHSYVGATVGATVGVADRVDWRPTEFS